MARRHVISALATVTLTATAYALPARPPAVPRPVAEPAAPATFNLDAEPAALLPDDVSTAEPVHVVTTVRDAAGRPVVTSRPATDRAAAEALIRAGQRAQGAVGVELDVPVTADATDAYRTQQWDFAKLAVANAWQLATGAGVTVAVLDTGAEAAHPDLGGNVVAGIDLVNDGGDGRIDPHGHGTHVAGTIAAVTGNDVGISGIAPDAKIMPVRVLGADGSGVMSDVAAGIVYAADNGAQVVNMSLSSGSQLSSVTQAIAYARGKGVIVVAAAGNSRASGSPTRYPAADPGVIAVASTDSGDNYSSFSNSGAYVDIAAPGSSILSTVPTGSYASYSGTSMASPHVAALAALLRSAQPSLTPDQVEQAMTSTALDLGAAGKDPDYGYGRIRPVAALTAVLASPSPSPSASATTSTPTSAPPTSTASPTTTTTPTTVPTAPTSTAPASTAPTSTAPTSTAPTDTPKTSVPVLATPVVTTAASSRAVAHGTSVATTFTVTAGGTWWANRPVRVCVADGTGGSAFACTAATTSAQGSVRHVRTATRTFRVRLVVPATATSRAAASKVVTYAVKAGVGLRRAGSKALNATVSGAVGQSARVERYQDGRWLTVATYPAAASRTVSGLNAGYHYRLTVASTPSVTGATSAAVRL